MRFTQYLLIENMAAEITAIADQVIDQFADEQHWNTDEMVAAVLKQLQTDSRFQDQNTLKSAEDFLYQYLR